VPGPHETVELAAGELEATFVPSVGMVGSSLRHRGEELLGQRGGLDVYAERGSSFGIPLLHPWANVLERSYTAAGRTVALDFDRSPLRAEAHGLAIHGLLTAARGWRVEEATATTLAALFDFDRPELLAAFPFPHSLRVDVELSPGALSIETALTPTGDTPVPVSFGWHPYLTLPGVPRAEFVVGLPVRTRAVLDERVLPTGATEPAGDLSGPLGDREFDDLFPELGPEPAFTLTGGGRRLAVEFGAGYPVAQVYAPAGSDFICFEPMTAPVNALATGDGLRLVEPGGDFRAGFRLTVGAST
jgi:aldose 1-epimerase